MQWIYNALILFLLHKPVTIHPRAADEKKTTVNRPENLCMDFYVNESDTRHGKVVFCVASLLRWSNTIELLNSNITALSNIVKNATNISLSMSDEAFNKLCLPFKNVISVCKFFLHDQSHMTSKTYIYVCVCNYSILFIMYNICRKCR